MDYPKIVTIIGANGTMGKLVAGIIASFGDAKVYMVCRDMEKAKKAKEDAIQSVRAGSIGGRLKISKYSQLADCIKRSDWIFESVAEDSQIKNEVNQMINQYAREDAIISTGTSGLSVTKLAETFSAAHQKYYLGTHFFNPPYQLTLCEVIPTPYTDRAFLDEFTAYLKGKLVRGVVEIKDKAGFLGNRVGFGLMNEALILAEKYKERGGIDYIDALLGSFTGRSMPPVMTLDFVGLDIYKAIVDHLHEEINDYTKDTFIAPSFVTRLIRQGRLGRKSEEGFYKTVVNKRGQKERWVYDIETRHYRKVNTYEFNFIEELIKDLKEGKYQEGYQKLLEDHTEESRICINFLLKNILYAITAGRDVASAEKEVDLVMTNGFNWIPPLGLIELFGGSQNVKKLCEKFIEKQVLEQIDLEAIFNKDFHSDYDYRRYLRAKK